MKSTNSLLPLKALLLAISLTAIMVLPGCLMASNNKNEKKVETTVSIPDFSSISASNAIQVIYTQGKATGVANITTTANGNKYLKVEVKSGCLHLYYQNTGNNITINGPTIVTVQSPSLKKVDLSSAAKLQVEGNVNQQDLIEFDLSSAAKADLNSINSDNLQANLSSSASLSVKKFNGNNINIVCSSASKAIFEKVECTDAWLHTSSAAKVTIDKLIGGNLNGDASSGSSIKVNNVDCMQVGADASSGAKIVFGGKCAMLSKEASSGGRVDTSNLSLNQSPSAAKKTKKSTSAKNTNKTTSSDRSEGLLRIP